MRLRLSRGLKVGSRPLESGSWGGGGMTYSHWTRYTSARHSAGSTTYTRAFCNSARIQERRLV